MAQEEVYISFEVAKLLKEKGFNEPCYRWLDNKGDVCAKFIDPDIPLDYSSREYYLCPSQSMAMKWLREVHNIYLNINVRVILGQWAGYDISIYTTDNDGFLNKDIPIKLKDNISYEQAVEAGIKYVLENLI